MNQLKPALVLLALLSLLTGVVYPLLVTIAAQTVFPHQANGSLITRGSDVVGSSLIGQWFSDAGHFWGRLSATMPFPYNAAASGGSNLGPLNPGLYAAANRRIKALREADPDMAPIPIDLVTASASGLDPQISPAAALYQADRVARARGLSGDVVRRIIHEHTEGRTFGLLGEPRVNVLQLNLALDALGNDGFGSSRGGRQIGRDKTTAGMQPLSAH